MHERMIAPQQDFADQDPELSLRPKALSDFNGQEHLKENLGIAIKAAGMRGEALDHCLFAGPPGLGKTTLAGIIAQELGGKLHVTSGPILDKPSDLAGLLTSLGEGDILFIDEIHRLPRVVEEYLYPAMEDFRLDIVLESGPMARSINLPLKRFTLVGATTRSGMLTSPLRDRFGLQFRLELYQTPELQRIVKRSCQIMGLEIDEAGSAHLASLCRGTPRIANRILRRCRDVALVKGTGMIDLEIAQKTLKMLGVDEHGLDEMDRKILHCFIDKFEGGPVGLSTIGSALGEEAQTIEEVYEPYLIQQGFLKRTPRGRMTTYKAYQMMGVEMPRHREIQSSLFDTSEI